MSSVRQAPALAELLSRVKHRNFLRRFPSSYNNPEESTFGPEARKKSWMWHDENVQTRKPSQGRRRKPLEKQIYRHFIQRQD